MWFSADAYICTQGIKGYTKDKCQIQKSGSLWEREERDKGHVLKDFRSIANLLFELHMATEECILLFFIYLCMPEIYHEKLKIHGRPNNKKQKLIQISAI